MFHIFIVNGTGKNRNSLQIDNMNIIEQEKEALIGFHAITGNDYVLSFFGKGKRKCVETVTCLGESRDLSEALFTDIEEYICAIYNAKKKHCQTVE